MGHLLCHGQHRGLWHQRRETGNGSQDQIDSPCGPCRENRIADVRCLQEGRQVLFDVRDDAQELL
jgi:hypothetical protein